jgi:hypothetical protein
MAMSTRLFTQKDNIQMLWDIVSDEDVFRFLSPDIQSKLSQVFINNIQGFYENEKTKTNSLVELNKKYMVLILNHIKAVYPNQPSKIKIHKDTTIDNQVLDYSAINHSPIENFPVKKLITNEEIQMDRKSRFDKDFTKRQEEFEDSMNIKVPDVPDFSNKQTDVPIKEMAKILKEMTAQRNYDVEQINKLNDLTVDSSKWLKSQETSLKKEKFSTNLALPVSPNEKKMVSWKNAEDNDELEEVNDDIFSKLKRVETQNINMEIRETKEEMPNNQILIVDRLEKLERSYQELNDKMDKILQLFSNVKD